MFSAGNVEEKKRIGRLVAKDEVVLDCFGGIGYFVFPLLVHAQVRRVMACDLNAWSLQGMQRGAVLNKIAFHSVTSPTATLAHVTAPLVMYHGDVRDALPLYRHQVDRVHLGLLPSSQVAYESAVLALKPTGGWMHIHGNVEEFQVETWTATTVQELSDYFHQHYDTLWTVTPHRSTCVKSFAPHVHHWVLDMECRPSSPVPVPPE
jgi:tRNA wybutosine-synthesizing protein 2